MYHVTRINRDSAVVPPVFQSRTHNYHRQVLVDQSTGSPHMSLSVCWLEDHGYVEPVLHSHELSMYVFSGEIVITMQGASAVLSTNDCIVISVGVTYSIRAQSQSASWLQTSAPAEVIDNGRRTDTFFTGEPIVNSDAETPDLRDPRNLHTFHFDSSSMNLQNLAVGSKVNAPAVSASMATALLAYSGIGVRMLVDQRVGAQLHTMFMVQYQPTAIAHPHDHPFEEAYVFVEGEVHALVEGNELVLHPGDVLWAGVGADHGFENRGTGLVRWIEMQAPQPPSQHSYRFSRDWEYLEHKLGEANS